MTSPAWIEPLRAQLPLLERCVYLNTGTAGPIPTPTADAIDRAAAAERTEGRGDFTRFAGFLQNLAWARALVAQLLGAHAEEIALCHHSSDAINIVLWGIDWQPGDRLVTTTLEHDAAAVPIGIVAERYGLQTDFVDVGNGEGVVAQLERALAEDTKLVVLSHITYSSGALLPIPELVQLAHQRGAQVLVDGAQSCGAIPIDVSELGADYYTLSGQKWLCGPEGSGALYVRRERLATLRPTFTSYFSAAEHDFRGQVALHDGACRFETGMVYRPALAGFVTSLEWMIEQVEIDRAWLRTQDLVRQLRAELEPLAGVVVVTPEQQASPLLCFDLPDFSPARLNALALHWSREHQLVVRSIDHPPYGLRASVGFFNTPTELEQLLELVREALRRGPSMVSPDDAWQLLPDAR